LIKIHIQIILTHLPKTCTLEYLIDRVFNYYYNKINYKKKKFKHNNIML